jgi:iron complex transport system ATP-binding protein
VRGVSLSVAAGELVAVVGPNGSGKTSLLRALLGVLPAAGGTARVMGRPVEEWNARELARVIGVVTQREEPAFPIRVRHAVMFGRYPHMGPVGAPGSSDEAAVDRALERCDVVDIAPRWVGTLSGGEWQRVRIARALAQEPLALVLDEPTANLDIRHEMEVFELVAELVGRDGLAGLLVTHHVNLAARFADRIVVMEQGRVRAVGEPRAVLTRANLESVFGWPVEVVAWGGAPQFVPLRRERR